MAATLVDLITWEAFERLAEDGMHREILQGEMIVLPPAKLKHSLIVTRIGRALRQIDDRSVGVVMFEAGYKLSDNPPTWIQPDVSVIAKDRADAQTTDGYFHGGPELAIEVISPSDTARDMNRKVDLLLAAGTLAVWVIYPDDQEVRIFLPDGTSFSKGIQDSLPAPHIFGLFEIAVSDLFA
jgi:Uma2 family endonuclease